MGDMTPLEFPCFLASVRNCLKWFSVSLPWGIDPARDAAVNPERLPKTIRSSNELPISRFRPCNPPDASPATNKFFTLVSEFASIFTPPF